MPNKVFKQRRRDDTGVDDWLMTYADMITLLLCFFVIILSVSMPKVSKLKELEATFHQQFNMGGGNSVVAGNATIWDSIDDVLPESKHDDVHAHDVPVLTDGPKTKAEHDIAGDELITLEMSSNALFAIGASELSPKGEQLLHELMPKLINPVYEDFTITVEGHTDDEPIHTAQFPSNWELSSARASAVVRYFISQGISPGRLRAMGYADVAPNLPNRADNGDPISVNQAANRRVVIKLEKLVKR